MGLSLTTIGQRISLYISMGRYMRLPVVSWIVSVLLLVGLLAWLGTGVVPLKSHANAGEADVGGAFTLLDAKSQPVTDKDFRGKYMLVFFGFTHCPDICPTTLNLIANAYGKLGAKTEKLTPVFITVDPERDTPKVVGDYVKNFSPKIVGLSGSPEQVKTAIAAYKVYAGKVESEQNSMGYLMDHSAFIYLMGPDGKYVTHFPSTIAEQSLATQLAAAIK